jgi:hypothetical protein
MLISRQKFSEVFDRKSNLFQVSRKVSPNQNYLSLNILFVGFFENVTKMKIPSEILLPSLLSEINKKWGVKNGFPFALHFFLLISDDLGGVK